jgi:glycosyltransferase involved in cell wall biosynthesis
MTRQSMSVKVTVGIPTRNRAAYVTRALRSVLAQTYTNVEVVVSDNASTDDTIPRLEEIADSRVVLLKQQSNKGMVGNFNACLQAATGKLFLMLSDDDVLQAEAVEELSRPFRHSCGGMPPDRVGMSWCPCLIIDSAGNTLWTTETGPAVETPISLITSLFNGRRGPRFCGVMVRTADALLVSGYNETRHGALCDTGNWARVALLYDRVACIARPLSSYTIHPASETSKSACRDWQTWGENICADLIATLRPDDKASGERALRAANRNHVANITVSILIQTVGSPGWAGSALRELVRSRRYFSTAFVAGRVFRDGWKILRLRRKDAKR